MKSPIYLRRALIAGTAAAVAVAGVAVGAAPSYATPAVNPVAPPLNGCPTSNANPGLAQQPIQAAQWADVLNPGSLTHPTDPSYQFAPLQTSNNPSAVAPTARGNGTDNSNLGVGYGGVTCDGVSSFVIGSDANALQGTQGQWEGVTDGSLPDGVKTVSASMYIDPKEPTQLSGITVNAGGTNTIGDPSLNIGVVYVSQAQVAGVKNLFTGGQTGTNPVNFNSSGWWVFNQGSGAWSKLTGVPGGINGWSTIEITIDPSNASVADVYVNGVVREVTAGGNTVFKPDLNYLSLVQYNNGDGTNSYDTYYQGLVYSTTLNTPLTVNTLSGSDRYATAVAISKANFPNGFVSGTGTVVLATGQNYADALSGAPLASLEGGPLLLTQTNSLPSEVQAELVRLHPANVIVLGGFGAVASSVYDQIRAAIPGVNLVQVAGADRYATSLAIAQNYFSSTNNSKLDNGLINNKVTDAFIATGTAFPDALSAAPAAGAGYGDHTKAFPVLLVNGTSTTIPAALSIWLQTNVTHTLYVAGGSGAVSPAVVNQLASNIKGSVHPFSGTDRYDTNFLINGNNTQAQNTNLSWGVRFFKNPTTVYLATGLDYPDALAGGAAAGYKDAPLFLTNGTCVPANVLSTIASWGTVNTINVLGGTGAQSANIAALKSC